MAASAMYISRDGTLLLQKQEEAGYEGQVLAREAAHSAFNIIVGRVKRDFDNYRETETNIDYRDVTYDVSAQDGPGGTVEVTALGSYDGYSYQVSGILERGDRHLFDAITIDGPVTTLNFENDYYISGLDENLDGSSGAGPHVRGLLVSSTDAYEKALNSAAASRVVGSDGLLDIVQRSPRTSLDMLESAILNYDDAALLETSGSAIYESGTMGDPTAPRLLRVDGNVLLGGDFSGYGVLYATGNITFEDNAVWHGLVFGNNTAGGDHLFEDNSVVLGSLLLRTATGDPDAVAASREVARSADVIQICHKPPGNRSNMHTLTISSNALNAHLDHGDTQGACDSDLKSDDGTSFNVTIRDNATVRFSRETLMPLKAILEQVDIGNNEILVTRTTEKLLK